MAAVEGEVSVEGEIVESVEEVTSKCRYPVGLSSFDSDSVNFGDNGVDANGEICNVKPIVVYRPVNISTSGGQGNAPVVSGTSRRSSGRLVTALHIGRGENSESANEAVVLFRDKNNNLNIQFISSSSFNGIEKKIANLINDLLFKGGDVDANSLNGMSVQEAELVVNRSKSIPWVLWVVLFVMTVSFLFFGKFLVLSHKKIISKGIIALSKGDYSKSVKIYNELVNLHSSNIDSTVRQDILDYLILLRKKIGDNRIELNLPKSSRGLPRIDGISSVYGLTNEFGRVEKMILDALRDIKDSPKTAVVRMPVVANAYKNLDVKSRRNLAPLYESLVYRMRNLL